MKGRFTTKTIVIAIIALILFAVAITGTVIFLKDSGEASATEGIQNIIGTEQNTPDDNQDQNDPNNIANINGTDNENSESNSNENGNNNNQNTTTGNNANNIDQEEPAPTTIEREKVVSETTTLGWNNIGFNSEINAKSFEINYSNLEYKVEYYFNGVLEEDLSAIIGKNSKGKIIDTYEEKAKEGYKLEKVENLPLTINENEEKNIIKVYYVADETVTKTLKYTVKYYLNNVEQEKDKVEKTKTVWINSTENTMEFDSSLLNKEYKGYKKANTNPATVGATVENGAEIKVYYVADETVTKTLKYTVRYYLNNVEQKDDKVEKTKTVWVNSTENTMELDANLLNKEYKGYKKVKTDPIVVRTTVENGAEIKVYYEADETETKTLKYTIKYYLNNVEQEKDKVERTKTVWINSTENTMEFDSSLLNKEYKGYKKVSTNPATVGTTVENGAEIKVYYVADETVTKTLKYTVKYYLNNVEQEKDKVEKTKTVWINSTENTMEFDSSLLNKEYKGYKKVSTNPATVGATVENGAEIKVYYVADETVTKTLKYTVRYYLNNVEQKDDKVERTKTVWINSTENTMEFDSSLLNKEYKGYKKVSTNPATVGTTVENGAEIKVYYIKPANITVSKESEVVGKTTEAAEKGDEIKYTIKAKNTGDESGTVVITDVDLKTSIDNGLIEMVSKTGYSGTNTELVNAFAGNGLSLTVNPGETKEITYKVKILAGVGTTITNKVEVISGGKVDKEKDGTTNKVEKTATIIENTETIKGKNIVVVIDLSASMNDVIDNQSKLDSAKAAAKGFITKIFKDDPNGKSGTKLSLVTFNYGGSETSSGNTDEKYVGTHVFTYGKNNSTIVTNKSEAEAMNSAIDDIELDVDLGTNMGAALIKAEQQLAVLRKGNKNEQVIIFLGDGDPSTGGSENTETAINSKATELKNAGVEIYTIGFGLNQKVWKWCPAILNLDCKKEHTWFFLMRCHQEDVYEENAIRILRNMANGTEGVDKEQYAKRSTGAQSLIDTFNAISSSIAVNTNNTQSTEGKIELSSTIYANTEHPIIIKVNGSVDTTLTALPNDAKGKIIKEGTKYYLDLTKFDADATISITYFSK